MLVEGAGQSCCSSGLSGGLGLASGGVFVGADLALLKADRVLSAVSGWRAWCDCTDA